MLASPSLRRQRGQKRRFGYFRTGKAQDKDISPSPSVGATLFRESERFVADDGRGEMRGEGKRVWECDATRGEVISPVACAVPVDSHRHPVALPPGSACVLEPGNSRSGRRCALYSHSIISLLSFFLLDFEGPPTAAIRALKRRPQRRPT